MNEPLPLTKQAPAEAETVDQLIAALQEKKLSGLVSGDTKLQYIIMNEDGALITMKMKDYMADRVIKVLKTMIRKIKK